MKSSPTNADPGSGAFFFVPLAYFVSTRLKSVAAVVSWIMIYPVPLFVSVWPSSGRILDVADVVAMFLAMLATYVVYELGYMDNDTRTVRSEHAPTERLSIEEKTFWERMRWGIVALRILIVFAASFAITRLVHSNDRGIVVFWFGLVTMAIVFPIYNSIRGRLNLPLHFILVVCRFCLPGMVLVSSHRLAYLVMMIVAFPLINLAERSGEARYQPGLFARVLKFKDRSRVIYYLVVTVAAIVIEAATGYGKAAVLIFGYFLAYRLISPLLFQLMSSGDVRISR